jgi:integrase
MARPKGSTKAPTYRIHPTHNQAITVIDGRMRYLGKPHTPESYNKYRKLLAEWYARGQTSTPTGDHGVTVTTIIAGWLGTIVEAGRAHINAQRAARVLRRLYGDLPAGDFGPLRLIACREDMARTPIRPSIRNRSGRYAVHTVNGTIGHIIDIFSWAEAREMVPRGTAHALREVKPLKAGELGLWLGHVVPPVDDDTLSRTMRYVPPTVADVLQLLRLTGARAGEICGMKGAEIDRAKAEWNFIPAKHKTAHLRKKRIIPLGPRARKIIERYLRADPEEFLFKPLEVICERDLPRYLYIYDRLVDAVGPTGEFDDARARDAIGRDATKTEAFVRSKWLNALRVAGAVTPGRFDPQLGRIFHLTGLARSEIVIALQDRARRRAAGLGPARKRRHRDHIIPRHLWIWINGKIQGGPSRAPAHWHPHQLRHTHASEVNEKFSLDHAREILGHSDTKMTERYAVKSVKRMHEVANEVG